MAKLLWRLPVWVHELMHLITGYKPVISLDPESMESAYADREGGTIDWRKYESQAKGFSLMKFPQ